MEKAIEVLIVGVSIVKASTIGVLEILLGLIKENLELKEFINLSILTRFYQKIFEQKVKKLGEKKKKKREK